jgi:sporulation protein YlmC with PRC-barrel domain
MALDREREVVPLRELADFKVAEGYPDARGYTVVSSDGRVVGKVRELHVDPQALRTRFLEVEEASIAAGGAGNCVLLPVTDVQIHGRERIVHLAGLTAAEFATLPPYAPTTPRAGDPKERHGPQPPKS